MTARRHVLSARASFWVAAAVVAHTLWTSAAPAMTYPLYAAQWALTPTMTTAVFGIYPIVVVAMLILFGDISDHIGRRFTILLGLAASIVGVLCFAMAPSVAWLFIGRCFMGIGVGLSAGPSSAAMLEFSAPGQSKRASSVNTASQAAGLTFALLTSGLLIEYAPLPTRLNFWLLTAVLLAIFSAAFFLPSRTGSETPRGWKPRVPYVAPPLRRAFAIAVAAVSAAYALGGMLLAVGAHISSELIRSSNVFVNAAILSTFAISVGVVGILAKQLPARLSMGIGGMAAFLAMALLSEAARRHSIGLFFGSSVASGFGYSLLYLGGMNLISVHAPLHHRGGTLSSLYLIAYLMQGLVSMLVGRAATSWGMGRALNFGAAGISGLCVVVVLLAIFLSTSTTARSFGAR